MTAAYQEKGQISCSALDLNANCTSRQSMPDRLCKSFDGLPMLSGCMGDLFPVLLKSLINGSIDIYNNFEQLFFSETEVHEADVSSAVLRRARDESGDKKLS
jgi:hypothetical protein